MIGQQQQRRMKDFQHDLKIFPNPLLTAVKKLISPNIVKEGCMLLERARLEDTQRHVN